MTQQAQAYLVQALEETLDELTTQLFDNAPCEDMGAAEAWVEQHPVVVKANAAIAKAKGGAQ